MKRLTMLAVAGALALAGCGTTHATNACAKLGTSTSSAQAAQIWGACLHQEGDAEREREQQQGERNAELARTYEKGETP